MQEMFVGSNPTSLAGWDVSNVTNMKSMFYWCAAWDGAGVDTWDVSSVENFGGMFSQCHNFNVDISGWNTSSATDLYNMFARTHSFNQPIGYWDVSNVTTMRMFSISHVFDQT